MVVDSNTTNYKDFVSEIGEKYRWCMNETIMLNYFDESNRTIPELSSDQDMVAMFAKFGTTKTIAMLIMVHDVNVAPDKPEWPIEEGVSVDIPCTSSLPSAPPKPPQETSSQRNSGTHPSTLSNNYVGWDLANPFEENEHVGVDEEDMYLDGSDSEDGATDVRSCKEKCSVEDPDFVPEVGEEYSDEDTSEDGDWVGKDKEPDSLPDFSYDKEDPPMAEVIQGDSGPFALTWNATGNFMPLRWMKMVALR
ncbi:hypothetical protein BRADI_1g60045v3 [Brachypodium distachyon]|uniref:PB1 domain-containing protein n=1 Tax=Brachypodium distachyon TaxID=15368 RepID=A0A0Q3LEA7_BRADI|nr:hypothetical protein BRADI_1g60045v3 [Brachypodium distachyon]